MRVSAITALVFALAGCGAEKGREVEEVPPGITFEGFRFRAYQGAELAVSGQAARASFRRDSTDLSAEVIAVRLPGRSGEGDAHVTAARGEGNLRSRVFEAAGEVTGRRQSTVVTTERARWDGGERLVVGEEPVALRGPGYALDGPGFVLDPATATVRISGKGTLRVGRGVGR